MTHNDDQFRPNDYPSISLAYAHVPEAYAGPQRRLNLIKDRMGALVSLGATVTLAMPSLMRGMGVKVDYLDRRFLLALLCGLVVVCAGLWQRNRGTVKILDLVTLRDECLTLSEDEFRWRVLYWAGQHFDINSKEVSKRASALDWLTGLFLVQVTLFTWWISFP